jgi:hypothetical protein
MLGNQGHPGSLYPEILTWENSSTPWLISSRNLRTWCGWL